MSKLRDFSCPSCPAVFLLSCSLPSSCLYKKNNMKKFYNNMSRTGKTRRTGEKPKSL